MDRFDDIWKNRFNEKQVPAEDWAMPDEVVWDNIAVGIAGKRKRRSLFFWLPFVGGGMVLLVLGFLVVQNTAGPLDNLLQDHIDSNVSGKVESVDSKSNPIVFGSIESAKQQSPDLEKINISESKVIQANLSVVNKKGLEFKKASSELNSQSRKTKNIDREEQDIIQKDKFANSDDSFISFANENNSNLVIEQKISDTIDLEKKITVASNNREIRVLNKVDFLPNLNIEKFNKGKFVLDINFHNILRQSGIQSIKNKELWSIAANGGVVYWQNRISDQYQSDLSPFDFNYSNNFGFLFDLNLERKLNSKLSFGLGLSYETVITTSGHNSEISYNKSAELVPAHNAYELNLATPYGLNQANFLLFRNTEVSDEELDLVVDFESKHSIQNLSLPLSMTYHAVDAKRLKVGFSLGLGVNYLLDIKNEISLIDTHHSSIEHVVGDKDQFVSPEISKWHFDIRPQIKFEYSLKHNTRLSLHYRWIRGLNPIFEMDKYSTSVDRHQLTLGFKQYIF